MINIPDLVKSDVQSSTDSNSSQRRVLLISIGVRA